MEGNKIVLKAPEGMTFRVQEEKDGVIVIDVVNIVSAYSDDYKNPVIPEGFEYLKGEWNSGFTIRSKTDESEFVWVPVGSLEADGTLDGVNFNEKFGRRNFYDHELSEGGYYEEIHKELFESVKKYGGYYFSAYLASEENGKPVFKKGNMPWVNIDQYDSKSKAMEYAGDNHSIGTCLPNGAAYDSLFKWIIQTGAKTLDEVADNSTLWGNYRDAENSPMKVTPTGSNEDWSVYNIYDLAGNCDEWSTEQSKNSHTILRGGDYIVFGHFCPAADRISTCPNGNYDYTSFRAVLYVK